MRVFRGGHFQGKTGKNFPSLMTCDMIDPNTPIFIDGTKNSWRTILNTQLSDWVVNYKKDDLKKEKSLLVKMEAFDKFWEHIGRDYCQRNNYNYIKKMKDMEEIK